MAQLAALLLVCAGLAAAQNSTQPATGPNSGPEDFKVYSDHPRLLVPARRLRLLRREKERDSIRWQQFRVVMSSTGDQPEPGFAYGLYYLASQDTSVGQSAVLWALSAKGTDLRQLALVYDWCFDLLNDSDKKKLADKMIRAIEQEEKKDSVTAARNRVLAAVALAGHVPDVPEKTLRAFWNDWWMAKVVPAIRKSRLSFSLADSYPLLEAMHVIRDNFNFDMRDNALAFFRDFPIHRVLSYYPAVFPAAENFYRIPQYPGTGEPDLAQAIVSRAADLAVVAFDANAQEHQFVQGWLIQDRFVMRGPAGIPYEFLWANPYQPGLSYHHLPQFYHDPNAGLLYLRSNWEEDAIWLSYSGGEIELFMDGRRSGLKPVALKEALPIGEHLVMLGDKEMQFTLNLPTPTRYFLLGLKPRTWYELEVDDEELRDEQTDAGGVLVLNFPASAGIGVRLRESAHQK
jgi:hypothetical protein